MTLVNCVKCRKEFEVKMIPIHDSKQFNLKGQYPPMLFCKLRSRKEFAKCQLCRNLANALNFLNSMS